MKKIRILLVCPTANYCGVDVCFEQLVLGLDRNKFVPIVVLPFDSFLQSKFLNEGIQVFNYNLIWWFPTNFSYNYIPTIFENLSDRLEYLCSIIDLEKIDIVYSNTSVFMDSAIAAHIKKIPHLWHIHASFIDNIFTNMDQDTKSLIYKLIGALSSKIITPSTSLKSFLASYIENDKIKIIYNGVDNKKFFPLRQQINNISKISLICVGHLNDNKNQFLLLEALSKLLKLLENSDMNSSAKLPDLSTNIKLILVGPSEHEYLESLKRKVETLSLQEHVEFLNFSDKIPELLRESFLLVNSSKTETFPVSLIEALASGIPVIATKTDGSKEILIDGETGYLVDNSDEFAEKILNLIYDKNLHAQLSKNAYEHYLKNFNINLYNDSFNSLFSEVSENEYANKSPDLFSLPLLKYLDVAINKVRRSNRKIKILAISPGKNIITSELVLKIPLQILNNKDLLSYEILTPNEISSRMLKSFDMILNLRCFDNKTIHLLDSCRESEIPFIFVTDDNYFALKFQDTNGKLEVLHQTTENENLVKMFSLSSAVLIFSQELENKAKTFNKNVYRLPTYQIITEKSNKPEKEYLTIGYMGSLMKDLDFEFVIDAILKIRDEFKEFVRFEFIGFIPLKLKNEENIYHFNFIENYTQFHDFFKQRDWDIALAPLAITAFNKSKTNNKFREYSSYAIPAIFSDIITYNECVTNMQTGLLVENTSSHWYNAMKKLILDKNLRIDIGQNSLEFIKNNYKVTDYCNELLKIVQVYSRSNNKSNSEIYLPLTRNANYIAASQKISKNKSYYAKSNADNLIGLKLSFGTHKESLKGNMIIEIFDLQKSKILSTVSCNLSEIQDNLWFEVFLPIIKDSKGKHYKISFSFEIDDNKTISIYEASSNSNFITKILHRFGVYNYHLHGYFIYSN